LDPKPDPNEDDNRDPDLNKVDFDLQHCSPRKPKISANVVLYLKMFMSIASTASTDKEFVITQLHYASISIANPYI